MRGLNWSKSTSLGRRAYGRNGGGKSYNFLEKDGREIGNRSIDRDSHKRYFPAVFYLYGN